MIFFLNEMIETHLDQVIHLVHAVRRDLNLLSFNRIVLLNWVFLKILASGAVPYIT